MHRSYRSPQVLARGGVLAALAVVFLMLSRFFPTMTLAMVAIAGILNALVLIESGVGASVLVYAAVSVLSAVFVPDSLLLYALFFGPWPIVKYLLERIDAPVLRWGAKIVCANLCLLAALVLLRLFAQAMPEIAVWLIWIAYNAAFVVYDLALTRFLTFYQYQLRHRIFRGQ